MLQPRWDKVVVKPDEYLEHATQTGIVIPARDGKIVDSQAQYGRVGTVVAVGPGMRDNNGNHIPIPVEVGQRVSFGEFLNTEFIDTDGQKYFVVSDQDITGVWEDARD